MGDTDIWVATSVPEPCILALLAMGAFGLLAYGWRWRK
ncbi:MAG: PEP-CTERM sorting domain-containing protein [Candidatus Nealsonbacteria bacterium]|nr:PEP-CTERM sorting domain-containing protein [Candidatus Nealsonbacteria bacterium]